MTSRKTIILPGLLVLIAAIISIIFVGPKARKASKEGQAYAATVSWHLYYVENNKIKHLEIQRGCKPLHGSFSFVTKQGKDLILKQETPHIITNVENPKIKELLK